LYGIRCLPSMAAKARTAHQVIILAQRRYNKSYL